MKTTTLKPEKTNENRTCLREISGINGSEWIIATYTKISQEWQLNRATIKYYLTKVEAEKAWVEMQKAPAKKSSKKSSKKESLTVVELKARCKLLGIKKYSKLRKAELIELLATYY